MSLIEIRGLSKNYGHVPALDRLNLNLDGGRIVGLADPTVRANHIAAYFGGLTRLSRRRTPGRA